MLQTVDVVANQEDLAENVDVVWVITVACGSSFCSSAAADAATALAVDAATTAACGSSFCSSAVADWDAAAVSTADANPIFAGRLPVAAFTHITIWKVKYLAGIKDACINRRL